MHNSNDPIHDIIRNGYAAIANTGQWLNKPTTAAAKVDSPASGCCSPASGGCCGPSTMTAEDLVAAIGYGNGELAAVPAGANMGLSCGNPTAIADLKAGDVVVDLGSGGGFDCFVAGPKVGATGRAIGIDMTPEMLSKARTNIPAYSAATGLNNVEFRLGEIENLPVADSSVDVVISNCVINLSPDKPRVYREISRVLRLGGKMAVSDLVLLRPLPDAVKADAEALIGCVAGASLVAVVKLDLVAAGFTDIVMTLKPGYVEALISTGDPLYERIQASLPRGTTVADFVTSVDIVAKKPDRPSKKCC